MLYIVSKTFCRANSKNKAMTAGVSGHNFAVKISETRIAKCLLYL